MAGIGFGAVSIGGNNIDNYKVQAGNGLGAVTQIVAVTKVGGGAVTQALMDGWVAGVTSGASLVTGDTTPDAFTVAGIAGTIDTDTTIYVALQGTGTLSTTNADYYAGVGQAVTCTFTD